MLSISSAKDGKQKRIGIISRRFRTPDIPLILAVQFGVRVRALDGGTFFPLAQSVTPSSINIRIFLRKGPS
jgi:hypothetical protein